MENMENKNNNNKHPFLVTAVVGACFNMPLLSIRAGYFSHMADGGGG